MITDKNCPECFNVAPMVANLKNANVVLTNQRELDRADDEAKALISQYAIAKLPALILRGEVQKNTELKPTLARMGDITDTTFVLRQIGGPYVVAATGEVKGKTELTLISAAACAECYDVTQHPIILSQFGLNPTITNVDAASPEGRAVRRQYQITLVPTFILTGEVSEYPALVNIWPQVGVVKDGAYVFTAGVSAMGTYQDLATGQTVSPSQAATSAGAPPPKQ